MLLFRRFLVVQFLMLWQGGFLFYVVFVVPVGTEVLGSSFEQGRITRFVTGSINLTGVIALAFIALDLLCSGRRNRLLWFCWIAMTILLVAQFAIRSHLMTLVNFDERTFPDHAVFYSWHRVYLWISTVQWAIGVVLVVGLLRAWFAKPQTATPSSL